MGFISNNLLKSIEWTDDTNNTIVYKYPMDGRHIMFGSKLTVREGQVAVFVNKGQIADVFEAGMHTLKTSNLPFLTQILALPYGFKSPFYADVYFINKKQFINQKWGTSNPITMRDSEFGTIRIKGYGTYSFKVDDSKLFLKQIFGTCSTYTTEEISNYLRSIIVSTISDTIAESKIQALDLASNLLEFSKQATEIAKASFMEIGLNLTKLLVENFSFPETVEKAIDTNSSLSVLNSNMDNYVVYKSAEALQDAAKNQGEVGLGAGIATSVLLADTLSENLGRRKRKDVAEDITGNFCPECGTKNRKNSKFCTECGTKLNIKQICKKCHAELPASAKFCPECGQNQKPTCPNCGVEVKPSAKFCAECGTKLK